MSTYLYHNNALAVWAPDLKQTGATQPSPNIFSSNNVIGIGTQSPSANYRLDVNGTVSLNKANAANNKLLVLWDGGSSDAVATASNFAGFGINTGALRYQLANFTDRHMWYNGSSNSMALTGSGLGIGTSNPSALLDVIGNARIASNLTVLGNLNISGATTTINSTTVNIQDNMIQLNNGAVYNVGLQAGIEVNRGTGYSNYYFVFDETSSYFKVGQTGQLQTVATREDTPAGTNTIPFYDTATARYLSSTNLAFSNNRLGVGTNAPSERLHVSGKVYSTSQILADSNDSATAPAFSFLQDSNTGISHPADDALGFVTAGTERVRVDVSGNVGIGTSTPTNLLDVNGIAKVQMVKQVRGNAHSMPFKVDSIYNTQMVYKLAVLQTLAPAGVSTGLMINGFLFMPVVTPGTSSFELKIWSAGPNAYEVKQNIKGYNYSRNNEFDVLGVYSQSNLHVYAKANLLRFNAEANVNALGYFANVSLIENTSWSFGGAGLSNVGSNELMAVDATLSNSVSSMFSANVVAGYEGVFSDTFSGFGTSNPLERLHVAGKIYSTSQILADSNDSSNAPAFSFMGDSNTGMWQPADDTLGFATGGVDRVRIDSSGRLGIGTSNPAYALDVNTSARFRQSTFTLDPTNNRYLKMDNIWLNLQSTAGWFKLFSVARVIPSYVTNGVINISGIFGWVGAGESFELILNWNGTNLGATLQTKGRPTYGTVGSVFDSSLQTDFIVVVDSDGAIHVYFTTGAIQYTHALLNVAVSRFEGGAITPNAGRYFNIAYGTTTGATIMAADTSVGSVAAVLSARTSLSSSCLVQNANNIGINTTSPAATLDVNGTALIRNGNAIGAFSSNQLLFGYSSNATYMHTIKTRHYSFSNDANNGFDFYVWQRSDAIGAVGSKHAASITSAGLGVFNSNPSYALDVNGTSRIGNLVVSRNMASVGDVVMFNSALPATIGHIGIRIPEEGSLSFNATSNRTIVFRIQDVERIRVDSNGNLGIGTASPAYALDVNGTISANKANTTNNKLLVLWDGNTDDAVATACNFYGFGINTNILRYQVPNSSTTHSWFCGTSNPMNLTNSGLALGTTTPSERLHVVGKVYATQQFLADSNDSSNAPAFSFMGDSNTGMWQPADDTLGFVTGGFDRVRIDSSGRVGIGLSNPSTALDVVGQIKTSSGLIINGSTYTDTSLNAWSNAAYFASNATSSTSAPFASNTAVAASNAAIFASNTSVSASNTAVAASNAGFFGSNTSVAASNTAIAASNAAVSASNRATFASNALSNYLPLTGGTVSGQTSFSSNIIFTSGLFQAGSNNAILSQAGELSISAESYLNLIMDNNSNNFASGNDIAIRFGAGNSNTTSRFAEFMRLTTLGRLGIGNSNPQALLDVTGDARVASNLTVLGNLNISGSTTTINSTTVNIQDNMIQLNNGAVYNVGLQAGIEVNRGTGYSNYYFVFDETSSYFKVGQTGQLQTVATREDTPAGTNTIPFYDTATARYLSSTNLAFSNNRLGVGTNAPSERLHVAGKIYATQQFLADSNDSATAPAFSFLQDSNTGISHAADDTLAFVTGGTERVRIDSAGNVGIGKSNPNATLEVAGNIWTTNDLLKLPPTAIASATGFSVTQSTIYNDNAGLRGELAFDCNLGTLWLSADRDYHTQATVTTACNTSNTPVGVINGEWVQLNCPYQSIVTSYEVVPGYGQYLNDWYVLGSSNNGSNWFTVDRQTNQYLSNGSNYYNYTTSNIYAADMLRFICTRNSNSTMATGMRELAFRGYKQHMFIASNTAGSNFCVTGLGMVGIGNTTPLERLHVAGKIYSTSQILADSNDSSNAPAFSFMGDSNTGMWQPADDTLGFATAGVDRVRIDSAGRVGIGVASPSYILDVAGTARAAGFTANTNVTVNNYGWWVSWNRGGTDGASYYMNQKGGGGGGHIFGEVTSGNAFTEYMRLTGTGRLGIGNSTPGYAVDVVGAIYASGNITAFSDRRQKENIIPLSNALDTIGRLTGYSYTRKDYEILQEPEGRKHIGLIAQEVEQVIPEIVSYDARNDKYGVDYGSIAGMFVEAIKELRAEVTTLRATVETLQNRINELV